MRSSSINISLWTTVLFVFLVSQFLITIESRIIGRSYYIPVRNALHTLDDSDESDEDNERLRIQRLKEEILMDDSLEKLEEELNRPDPDFSNYTDLQV